MRGSLISMVGCLFEPGPVGEKIIRCLHHPESVVRIMGLQGAWLKASSDLSQGVAQSAGQLSGLSAQGQPLPRQTMVWHSPLPHSSLHTAGGSGMACTKRVPSGMTHWLG